MSTDDFEPGILRAFQSKEDSTALLRMFTRQGNVTGGYFVLGAWAPIVASEYVRSDTVVKNVGTASAPINCTPINEMLAREVIRDALLHRGASVEVYDRPSGGGAFECVKQGSPGSASAFEDILFSADESAVQLMCYGAANIVVDNGGQVRVGTTVVNGTLRQIDVCAFTDSMQLVNLDAIVTQSNVKELYVPGNLNPELRRTVGAIAERCNCSIKSASSFSASYDAATKVKSILTFKESSMMLMDLPTVTPSLACLMQDSPLLLDDSNLDAFRLRNIQPDGWMRLDAAAVQALNLVAQGPEAGKGRPPISVFGWLNQTSTGMGSRLLRQWILQPLRSAAAINDRLNVVEALVEQPQFRDSLHDTLRRCMDMDRICRKIQRGTISLKESYGLLTYLATLENVTRALGLSAEYRHGAFIATAYLEPLQKLLEDMGNLHDLIDLTLEPSDRTFRVKPEFDDDLQELEDARVRVLKDLEAEHETVLEQFGWEAKTCKLEIHASYGHVFRVSRKEDGDLRNSRDITIINTAKDGVRFGTKKLSQLRSEYGSINKEYEKRQITIKKGFMETLQSYVNLLDSSKEILAELDVYVTFANITRSSRHEMVRPTICAEDDGTMDFVSLRHPLVEARQNDYVPNSIKLTRETNGMIVTGPNMGGKSTLMRSVGVGVVLAQIGCFIPAAAATVSIRDAVLCRVGAADHMSQGVSTFMVEMLESAAILNSATDRSLVIVDELGRGTSTFDGFGLAWAIASEIACKIRATLLFSTHFHEITELADEHKNIVNGHVGADTETDENGRMKLNFTYTLAPGGCSRSFGIAVAEIANMPKEIVDEAKRKAEEMENFSEHSNPALRKAINTLSAEAIERVREYARRTQQAGGDSSVLAAIRQDIMADAEVSAVLAS